MVELGYGHEELYAFTFPSLRELASLKGAAHYPVKIGYTVTQHAGAINRIQSQIIEPAAFPERTALLLVYRTWDGRALELLVHAELRRRDRRLATAPGREWFMTNKGEVADLCKQLGPDVPKPASKPLSGASPGLSDLVAAGAQVELVEFPGSACVGFRITQPKPDEGTL
jgi:T5orf172 domain